MKTRNTHSFAGAARRLVVLALGVVLLGATSAYADSMQSRSNIVELITDAEIILRGNVVEVTDGFDENNLPYTQVKIQVKETIRGTVAGEYTFRQFGLLEPRALPNGHTLLAMAPDGFPRWRQGEYVIAFLYRPATRTGLQTTVGLAQGKLTLNNERLVNDFGNAGLFEGVDIRTALLSQAEQKMLKSTGPVDRQVFMGLVGRAVNQRWIEKGEMK